MTNGKSVKGRTMISKTLHRKHRRRISQISGVNSERVSSSCSTGDIRGVTLATIPAISHE
jgi:hypothetical protein